MRKSNFQGYDRNDTYSVAILGDGTVNSLEIFAGAGLVDHHGLDRS